MAAETFAYNFFNEKLGEETQESQVVWLSTKFNKEKIKERLREDPRTYPELGEGITDLTENATLNKKLVVGNIVQLNLWLEQNLKQATELKNAFGEKGGLDLVSGGPPCQSFSMAGLRQFDNKRNLFKQLSLK